MTRYVALILLALSVNGASASSYADDRVNDRYAQGKVIALTGSDEGVHIRLDSGKPPVCKEAPNSSLLVKPRYIGAFQLASISLGKDVGIYADYEPLQMECVVKTLEIKKP